MLGIGNAVGIPFTLINEAEMKDLTTANLGAGADTAITTTVPDSMEPYSLEFIDSSGNVITVGLGEPVLTTAGGYYVVTVYSVDALVGVKLKIIF